jgi:hypothetical protein
LADAPKDRRDHRAYADGIERLAQRAIPALKRGMTARAESTTAETEPSPIAHELGPAGVSKPAANEPSSGRQAVAETAAGEVATVTVDPMPGRGEFTTISDAISRAAPGTRIRIRPGHYREQLIINKPLELVGDGAREDIIVEAQDAHTLVFDTDIGIARGLTFKQSGAAEYYLVWIKQGRVALENVSYQVERCRHLLYRMVPIRVCAGIRSTTRSKAESSFMSRAAAPTRIMRSSLTDSTAWQCKRKRTR